MTHQTRPLKICVLGAATSNHVVFRAQIFQEFGHDVTFVSPVEGNAGDMRTILCAQGHRKCVVGKLSWIFRVLKTVSGLKADIYHAHYAAELTSWAAWILRKKPLVITVMGADVLFDEQGSLGPLGRWLTKKTLKSADLVTVKSALLGKGVKSFGVLDRKNRTVIWGIDQRIFKPDPQGAEKQRVWWSIDKDKIILFSPRMLKPLYNQHLMVEALPLILEKYPNAVLVLSTYQEDLDYRAQVEQSAVALSVSDKVQFVPALAMQDMSPAYSAANVVLSLPPSDGTPQSVMEAMACGVPVVMSDLQRFRELFTHRETTWFTALDQRSVAEGAINILENSKLSEKISANAIELVKTKADFETQARQVEQMYYQLATNGRID